MTEIQNHLITLIREIDQACRDEGIDYILHGQTAGCALKNGKFKTGAYPFHIIVPEKDMPRLVDALRRAAHDNREIESRAENPGLELDVTRYVDSSTTVFDRKEAVAYQCSGAAITIHPFYEKQPDSKGLKGFLDRLFGRKASAAPPDSYELEISAGEYKTFPAECISRTKRIPFESLELPVSENSDLFFECFFGPAWKDLYAQEMQSTNSSFVIWDAQVPYRQYLEDFKRMSVDMAELFGKIRAFDEFVEHEFRPKKKQMLKNWTIAKRSEDKIALGRAYAKKIVKLRLLAADGDIPRLKAEMAEYLEKEDLYRAEGLDFYISKELKEFADQIRQAEGKASSGRSS